MADIVSQVSASVEALTREFDIITHNMANVSTTGFKRRCNNFTKVLAAQGEEQLSYSEESQAVFDFSQGSLVQTERTLDFALCGKGFFVIESPQGPLYTRHGSFVVNQNGQIVDAAGRLVGGMAGPLLVPASASPSQIHVDSNGRIFAGKASIGQFRVVEFAGKEDQLLPAGSNCFRAPPGVEPAEALETTVRQGYKEASNVKIMDELVNMIIVSRLYEANMKVVSVAREASSSTLGVAMG